MWQEKERLYPNPALKKIGNWIFPHTSKFPALLFQWLSSASQQGRDSLQLDAPGLSQEAAPSECRPWAPGLWKTSPGIKDFIPRRCCHTKSIPGMQFQSEKWNYCIWCSFLEPQAGDEGLENWGKKSQTPGRVLSVAWGGFSNSS